MNIKIKCKGNYYLAFLKEEKSKNYIVLRKCLDNTENMCIFPCFVQGGGGVEGILKSTDLAEILHNSF